jgi:hypothetical protein
VPPAPQGVGSERQPEEANEQNDTPVPHVH